MKKKLVQGFLLLAVLTALFFTFKPNQVDAAWDFDRGTGTWVVTSTKAYCRGSWWSNSYIGTLGYYSFEDGHWHDW